MRLFFLNLLVISTVPATSDMTVKCIEGKFEPHRDAYKTKKANVCYTSFTVKNCNDVDIHMFSDESSGTRKSFMEAIGEPTQVKSGVTECEVVPGHSAVLCRCTRDRCNKKAEELMKAVSELIRQSDETRLLECVQKRVDKMDDEDSCELIDDDGNPIEDEVVWEDDEMDESFWDPNEEYKKRYRKEMRTKNNVKEWYDPWGIVAAIFSVIFLLTVFIYFECINGEKSKEKIMQLEINDLKDEENLEINHENQVHERLFKYGKAGLQRKPSEPIMRINRLEQTSSTALLEISSATTIVEMPEAVSPPLVTARSPPQEYLSQSETSSVVTTNRQSTSRQSTSTENASKEKKTN